CWFLAILSRSSGASMVILLRLGSELSKILRFVGAWFRVPVRRRTRLLLEAQFVATCHSEYPSEGCEQPVENHSQHDPRHGPANGICEGHPTDEHGSNRSWPDHAEGSDGHREDCEDDSCNIPVMMELLP